MSVLGVRSLPPFSVPVFEVVERKAMFEEGWEGGERGGICLQEFYMIAEAQTTSHASGILF